MTVWYALVVVQSGLIMRDNHRLHMTLGEMSISLALGIVISGIMVTLESYGRSGRVDIAAAYLLYMISEH